MFIKEQIYSRREDIHAKFGGQMQGGIATPPDQPYVFLFTGAAGEAFGYPRTASCVMMSTAPQVIWKIG